MAQKVNGHKIRHQEEDQDEALQLDVSHSLIHFKHLLVDVAHVDDAQSWSHDREPNKFYKDLEFERQDHDDAH